MKEQQKRIKLHMKKKEKRKGIDGWSEWIIQNILYFYGLPNLGFNLI